MIRNFHKVNNHLYRGGNLHPKDVVFLKNKYNIEKIVSLDLNIAKRIDRTTKLLGIKHIILPIEVGKRSSLIKFLHQDIDKLLSGENVFIGCKYGSDRTGLAIALYRCKYDHWSCNRAINEAKKYGFGIGVDTKIVNLYLKLIKKSCGCNYDINAAYDIVSNQREYPSDYRDYTLDTWEQGSWSPYEDYRVLVWPIHRQYIDWEDQYPSREDYGLEGFTNVSDVGIPQPGQWDSNTQGISGAGPSLIGSGYI